MASHDPLVRNSLSTKTATSSKSPARNSTSPKTMRVLRKTRAASSSLPSSSSSSSTAATSCFSSSSSPWARRRSFLSPAMINDEKHSVYELASCYVYDDQVIDDDDSDNDEIDDEISDDDEDQLYHNSNGNDLDECMQDNNSSSNDRRRKSSALSTGSAGTTRRILSFSLSLKESQGFSWNQDLFASEYQQARAMRDAMTKHGSNASNASHSFRRHEEALSFNDDNVGHEDGEQQPNAFGKAEKIVLKESGDLINNSKFKIIHQKRRKSANNEREGYSCVEVSEIIVNESDSDDDSFPH